MSPNFQFQFHSLRCLEIRNSL